MTDVISIAETILARAGYICWRTEVGSNPALGFEDPSVMGFVFEFRDASAINHGWREAEASMIARYAHAFRRAGEKAWNVYCAFLTTAVATKDECRLLRVIEEDLEQTRKLTGTGQSDEESVMRALLPILPIMSRPQLGTFDATDRLARRLDTLSPGISGLLLDNAIEPVQVLQHLSQPR
jgi:hypothetical protein